MNSDRQSTTVDSNLRGPTATQDPEALGRGVVRLFELSFSLIEEALKAGKFRIKIKMIANLHKAALEGFDSTAGTLRSHSVSISNSKFNPPMSADLPVLLEEMCDYVNDNWELMSSFYLSAYVLWRLLWIHPFYEGNGIVARALSYIVLSVREGRLLPGNSTIPEQIALNRTPYYEALAAADDAWADGRIDVSRLQTMLSRMLEIQLKS